jgi:hypothetical protein
VGHVGVLTTLANYQTDVLRRIGTTTKPPPINRAGNTALPFQIRDAYRRALTDASRAIVIPGLVAQHHHRSFTMTHLSKMYPTFLNEINSDAIGGSENALALIVWVSAQRRTRESI